METPKENAAQKIINKLKAKLIKDLVKLNQQVMRVLIDYPKTRNSDKLLQAHLWTIFYPHLLKKEVTTLTQPNPNYTEGGDEPEYIDQEVTSYYMKVSKVYPDGTILVNPNFMQLPLGESVKRERAEIQSGVNKKNKQRPPMLLPTDVTVAKRRRQLEEYHRQFRLGIL